MIIATRRTKLLAVIMLLRVYLCRMFFSFYGPYHMDHMIWTVSYGQLRRYFYKIQIQVCFGSAETEMALRVTELWALINPAESKLQFSGTKLELALSKRSKVQWKNLEAKETEAKVLFGEPSKMIQIWPDEVREALPEELKEKLTVKETKKVQEPEKKKVDEPDLDIDEIEENEWG